ncbi:MAG: hypothetical protein OQK11_05630 [Thiovulaceae bacterium]|nr:hypothetical protein [Sulfurimonadaceae bacterium]
MRLLLILFVILPIMLCGADIYVKVGDAKSKYGLDYTYSKLNKMNMKIMYKTASVNGEKIYTIYSGPYESKNAQRIALNNVRRYFSGARLVRLSLKPEPSKKIEPKVAEKIPLVVLSETDEQVKEEVKSKFSLAVALGYATAPSTHVISSGTVTINEPNNSGINYLLKGTYSISDDLKVSLNYMRMDAKDLVFDNIYGSIGYQFAKLGNFVPQFSIALGLSALTWNASPLEEVSAGSNNDSESLLYGTELGITYKGYKNFSPFVQYHCMFMQHATNLTQDAGNTSKLQHKTLHTLLFGIEYRF